MARNAAAHIQDTLESLLQQTRAPRMLVVIDDGSTDGTEKILSDYERNLPRKIKVVMLPDNGYDIRRVPSNINLAWKTAVESGLDTRYFMISGDDCSYSHNYAEVLVTRMNNDSRIAVASGRTSTQGSVSQEHSPTGSGRFVRCSYWRRVGSRYPVKAGWETWLLYIAQENQFKVQLFSDVTFTHVRPRGAKHQFAYWGAAMYGLGYHPLYAVGRIAKNAISRSTSVKGSISTLRGYLMAKVGSSDPFISPFDSTFREFVCRHQVQRIGKLAGSLISRPLIK